MWVREVSYLCEQLNAQGTEMEKKRVIVKHRSDGASYFLMVAVDGENDTPNYIDGQFARFASEPLRTPPLDDDDFVKLVTRDAREKGVTLHLE